MKEFLVIGNSHELYSIDTADICYIKAAGNRSVIFLTNGEELVLSMQIGKILKYIQDNLRYHVDDFLDIGRSFVVNRVNLFYVNSRLKKLIFSDKLSKVYSKGYKDGYLAGHIDGGNGRFQVIPTDMERLKIDDVPKDNIKDLMKIITGLTEENNENNTR